MEERALVRMFNISDPRMQEPGFDPEQVSYLAEEMLDWGINPEEVSEEAYLKARDQFLAGTITMAQMFEKMRRYQAEYDRLDQAASEFLQADEKPLR